MNDHSQIPHATIGLDEVPQLNELKSQYDIFRFMKRLTESWGMKSFMVLNMPTQTHGEIGEHTVINNWPSELLQIYDQDGYLRRSNVIRELQRSYLPFMVDMEFMLRGHEQAWAQSVETQFTRFGMEFGLWAPVQDALGNRGAVGVAGLRGNFTKQDLVNFFYIANAVYGRLTFVKNLDARTVDLLSEREIDCLNWTASGKTSAEIAEIMDLSEHTVNHYLNRATKKLETVNRTQAVAKALRIGLIK